MDDINVNLTNCKENRGTYEFFEQLINHNVTPQITLQSRITEKRTAVIDNIFVNNQA